MQTLNLEPWQHSHDFHETRGEGERKTWIVIGITATMMVVEILGGLIFGSMALLADGWHMSTHAAALGITAYAYYYARRHADDPAFAFGTGKVGVLGGFTSAIVLAVVALVVAFECVERIFSPVQIRFNEALGVAAIGLAVNLGSAWLLRDDHGHHHHHHHSHDDEDEHDHHHGVEEQQAHGGHHHHHEHAHEHGGEPQDLNLRAAYLHVLADALTSVTAIVALLAAKWMNWVWMDPLVGMLGALVIARWSWGLIRQTSAILLDGGIRPEISRRIRRVIEAGGDARVADLHVWRVAPTHRAAIISVVTSSPHGAAHYQQVARDAVDLAHVTVEVHRVASA